MCRWAMISMAVSVGLVCSSLGDTNETGSMAPQSTWFTGLGNNVGTTDGRVSVSADGSTVVGYNNGQAFKWTAKDGLTGLGYLTGGNYSAAEGVSSDGSVIVGYSNSSQGGQAFRWTQDTGMVGLGDLPGGRFYSSAYSTSSDGSIVVGISSSFVGDYDAFRWDSLHGMNNIGLSDSRAYDVSGNGSRIVGQYGSNAYLWTMGEGTTILCEGVAQGISPDGIYVVGKTSNVAYRWTELGGVNLIGDLPGGGTSSTAYSVSLDGSIVGMGSTSSGFEAFLWTKENGIQNLKNVLTVNYGLDLTGWKIESAWDISADGMTIVGKGINPSGISENWIAVVPEPATLGLMSIGIIFIRRNIGS